MPLRLCELCPILFEDLISELVWVYVFDAVLRGSGAWLFCVLCVLGVVILIIDVWYILSGFVWGIGIRILVGGIIRILDLYIYGIICIYTTVWWTCLDGVLDYWMMSVWLDSGVDNARISA